MCRTETERFSPEQNLQPLIDEQRNHPAWGAYAAALLDDGKYQFPRMGEKDDQVRQPIQFISRQSKARGKGSYVGVCMYNGQTCLRCGPRL